ncbi:MAG: class I SAM-dependent methyltransferase [bacterium]
MAGFKHFLKLLSPKHQKLILEYPVDFRPRFGHGRPAHPGIYSLIDAGRNEYRRLLDQAYDYKEVFLRIRDASVEKDETQPSWNNSFLPGLDIVALYTMIRLKKPARYIEIGSGNSTKVAYKAVRDGKMKTLITSIDPFPRASIDQLAGKIIRQPVENIEDLSLFKQLEPGDILFIDNSHRTLPNSDATVCFLEIIPLLKKGVIVHIHDIYLPYDYPQFMCDRFYSEQYVLAAMILANPVKYRTILPNYFISEDPELSSILSGLWSNPELEGVEKHGGSFWMEIGS